MSNSVTAFVMLHEGKRLGWKAVRGNVADCFPDGKYFGVGVNRPPRHECKVERAVFSAWPDAEAWCAAFAPHPAEGGAPPAVTR